MESPSLSELNFLSGGGEMGARMRELDWSATPFGPPQSWPQSLRSAVGICLNTQFPIVIYWGEELALLYNDAWSPIPGKKHPWALGRPGREVWPENWEVLGPLFNGVRQTGEGVWLRDLLLPAKRHGHGYTEECYFNFSFSPIRGEDGRVAGIFTPVIETTIGVIEERRGRLLQELAERELGTRSIEEVCRQAASVLSAATLDVPFSLFYLLDGSGRATLATRTGAELPEELCPGQFGLDDSRVLWSASAGDPAHMRVIDDLGSACHHAIHGPDWPEPIRQAVLLPLGPRATARAGFLVAGVSPARALDPAYRRFFERIAAQVGAAISDAQAYEEERQRAEALAQIDRAKTAFFSNVSHEFRTPLTLILGPVEEQLADTTTPERTRERLDLAHRNALRLQKLVNSLLEFSRIEAGRVQASFEPVDLATLTRDLASTFRSTIERAGLTFEVDCPALPGPVYVDRDMWEKVVLNLLSNAFKFTFSGRIDVQLSSTQSHAVLEIGDTGVGVPASELPRLFERFYRVEGTAGRTHEGSGIGLALVQELVKLHGGSVDAESQIGQGTRFRIQVPLGRAHLPAEQIKSPCSHVPTATAPEAYVQEASRWLPDAPSDISSMGRSVDPEGLDLDPRLAETSGARIVLADDNADMRAYLHGLLSRHYAVEAAGDGEQALAAARRKRPDLILSDVMMPRLDGLGLLQKLRVDDALRDIPVILLSARAGEESRIEGLETGADDYLVKPFSARELLARVGACLMLARVRQQAAEALRASQERLAADLADIVRASNAVSAQATLEELMTTLLKVVLEHAGASRGLLIMARREHLRIEAEATTNEQVISVQLLEAEPDEEIVPGRLLTDTMRASAPIYLDDARAPGAYWHELYFRGNGSNVRSVLCLPILRQTKVVGLLYLENILATHAFTPDRINVLKLLASQAAIPLENASLEEKEALLREVHHRVKNNLQLITSLLNLQAARVTDPTVATLFAESRDRVRSMALVHETLYRLGNFARVPMTPHLESVCAQLFRAYAPTTGQISLQLDIDEVQLDLDRAVACGLIVNELVSNALKHAFPNGRRGTLSISLQALEANECLLRVRDDGVGMSKPFDPKTADTLGLQLVNDLADQLHGSVAMRGRDSVDIAIKFRTAANRKTTP